MSASVAAVGLLAGCGGSGGASSGAGAIPGTSGLTPSTFLSRSVNPDAVAEAVQGDAATIVYVGFSHAALSKSPYGPIAFYATTSAGATTVIKLPAATKIAFLNDDKTDHTASGLGSSGFPTDFDNTSGLTKTGTYIKDNLTWSTGTIAPNKTSATFTLGKPGKYYFGCYYHYHVSPSMRDVIVSEASS